MSGQPLVFPDEFEELDFSIEEENWNEYEFTDGNRMRARYMLEKIVRDPNNPDYLQFQLASPNLVTFAPPANRGKETTHLE